MTELDKALRRLEGLVEDGAKHGYFDYRIKCEIVNEAKRRLTIEAGKSYRFTITEDELEIAER